MKGSWFLAFALTVTCANICRVDVPQDKWCSEVCVQTCWLGAPMALAPLTADILHLLGLWSKFGAYEEGGELSSCTSGRVWVTLASDRRHRQCNRVYLHNINRGCKASWPTVLAKWNPFSHYLNCSAQEPSFGHGVGAAGAIDDLQKEVLSLYDQVSVSISCCVFEKARFGMWKLNKTLMPNPDILTGNNIRVIWDLVPKTSLQFWKLPWSRLACMREVRGRVYL